MNNKQYADLWKATHPFPCDTCKVKFMASYSLGICEACEKKEKDSDDEHQITCPVKNHKECDRCRSPEVKCNQM